MSGITSTLTQKSSDQTDQEAMKRRDAVAFGLTVIALTSGCSVDEGSGAAPPTTVNQTAIAVADPGATSIPEPPEALASAPPEMTIHQADFEGTWPFADDEVTVGCDDDQSQWVRTSGGVYALNGVAMTAGFVELTIDTSSTVWLDNESTGFKVSLSDVTDIAGDLCS